MQISRHWRMKANRYRLEGFRLPDGSVSLQNIQPRPGHEEMYKPIESVQSPKIVYLASETPSQESAAD